MEKITREEIVEKLLEKHEMEEVKEIIKEFERELGELGIELGSECSKNLFDNWYIEYKKGADLKEELELIAKFEKENTKNLFNNLAKECIEEEEIIEDREEKRNFKKSRVIGFIAGLTVLVVGGIFAKTKLSRDNTYVDTKSKTQTESMDNSSSDISANALNTLPENVQKELEIAIENSRKSYEHITFPFKDEEALEEKKLLIYLNFGYITFDERDICLKYLLENENKEFIEFINYEEFFENSPDYNIDLFDVDLDSSSREYIMKENSKYGNDYYGVQVEIDENDNLKKIHIVKNENEKIGHIKFFIDENGGYQPYFIHDKLGVGSKYLQDIAIFNGIEQTFIYFEENSKSMRLFN